MIKYVILCLIRPKKNLSVSHFLPTLLNNMLLKIYFRGLRDFRKNSTKTYVFCILASHYHVSLFRMYFCNSIFILNGETTYLIWHTVLKFPYIPPFT